jgi:hypothetical protein
MHLTALLLVAALHSGHVPPGHHYGWTNPHNPHHPVPCSVAFHPGCASANPPPVGPWPPGQVPHFPGLPS